MPGWINEVKCEAPSAQFDWLTSIAHLFHPTTHHCRGVPPSVVSNHRRRVKGPWMSAANPRRKRSMASAAARGR